MKQADKPQLWGFGAHKNKSITKSSPPMAEFGLFEPPKPCNLGIFCWQRVCIDPAWTYNTALSRFWRDLHKTTFHMGTHMKTKNLRHQIKGSAAVILAASSLPLSGQIAAQEDTIEEVIVTGSRISRDSNLTGALPVQSVNADDIRMSGEFSITDVVNDIPALLTSVTSEQSIDNGIDGQNTLNLRGLGAARTLVLVDGRRHVGGLQGTSSVDVGSVSYTHLTLPTTPYV